MSEAGRPEAPPTSRGTWLVVVAALGYFVDVYDLILFSSVRTPSLAGIGVAKEDLLEKGMLLFNLQLIGMMVGGLLWGVLGDKRGRLSVLFGSIFLYSAANLANAFIDSVAAYGVLRLLAGIGLAGELGAGVTLVVETLPKHRRGIGTTWIAAVGVLGAIVAGLVGDLTTWRTAYIIGGVMGFALLALRIGVHESGMFESVKHSAVVRGSLRAMFRPPLLWRYCAVVLVGLPTWYVVSILITFAPEMGAAMGMAEAPAAPRAIIFMYAGTSFGDLTCGLLSQRLQSRKRAIRWFFMTACLAIVGYFTLGPASLTAFYAACFAVGFGVGHWAVFVTISAEQFGTNLRATAATSVPNVVRGCTVGVTLAFQACKGPLGVVPTAIALGACIYAVAFVALSRLEETFSKDLDFTE